MNFLLRLAKYLHASKKQIAKFLLVGVSSAMLDLGLLVVLKEQLHLRPFLAVAIDQIIVISFNFLVNKFWSFGSKTLSVKQLIRYLSLVGFNYCSSIVLMYIFSEIIGINYLIVRVGSIGLLMSFNFVMYKHWVYKET